MMPGLLRYLQLLCLLVTLQWPGIVPNSSSPSQSIVIDKELQKKLNNVIKTALIRSNMTVAIPSHTSNVIKSSYTNGRLTSSLENICDNAPNKEMRERTACCSSIDTRVLYNAKIENNTIVMFVDKNKKINGNSTTLRIPPILSLLHQQLYTYKLRFIRRSNAESAQCKEYFNGTLHIMGEKTTHNLYHAIADNYAPLVSQIVLDSIVDPDYLYLPRVFLRVNDQSLGNYNNEGISHMKLMQGLASGGTKMVQQMNSVCFRRVVWGNGPYPFYQNTLLKLRRVIYEFSRSLMKEMYHIEKPAEYNSHGRSLEAMTPINKSVNISGTFLIRDNKPLNIVYYTRGTSGRGRSLKNERLLINALNESGANVIFCCDNFDRVPYVTQISYAYYADVLIGLHGAGLVNGLFMPKYSISIELKTVYGFLSSVFESVNDAREGTHGQIDIKSYFIPHGHKPVDNELVERLLQLLYHAIKFNDHESKNGTKIINYSRPSNISVGTPHPHDILVGHEYDPKNTNLNHILGPFIRDQLQECQMMLHHEYRLYLYTSYESYKSHLPEMDTLHCKQCYPYIP